MAMREHRGGVGIGAALSGKKPIESAARILTPPGDTFNEPTLVL